MKTGDKIEHRFVVDEQIYNGFISLSHDENPLHTSEAFAREKGFRSVVMHGNILNCFLSFFIGELLPMKNVIIASQEISFSRPVYLGDELLLQAMVADYFEFIPGYEFTFKFLNADGKAVAKGKILIKQI